MMIAIPHEEWIVFRKMKVPFYKKDLQGTYPKSASDLGYLDSSLVNRNPSLYELLGQLDQILYRHDGTPLREALLRHSEKLRNQYKIIQENIADWKLAQADKILYSIEDTFDDMESFCKRMNKN
jgi:hypothetical protein